MNVDKLIEKGQDSLKKRNYDYAISIFLEAVSFAPNNRAAREGLRSAELKKYEASYPSAPVRMLTTLGSRVGMVFAGLGKKSNPEGYMMACERYLTKDPKSLRVNVALGEAAAAAGHLEAAVLAYQIAAEHHPDDVTALKRLGHLLWKRGDIREAHEVFDRVVKIDPRETEALKARKNLAAEVSLKETGFERAESSLELVKDKEAAGRLEAETRLHRTEEDLSAERATLETKLEAEPDNVELLLDLVENHQKRQDYDGALRIMDRVIELRPGDINLPFQRADLVMDRLEREVLALKRAGDGGAARNKERELKTFRTEELRRRVKAYPTDLNLRFRLGELLLDAGTMDEAIGQFQQTVRDPRFAGDSQLRLGQAFLSKGQFDLALRQFERALKAQVGMTERRKEILYAMGEVNLRRGVADAARSVLSQIYEVDINYRDVAKRLAELPKGPEGGKDEGKLTLAD
ncbi:MAG: tetratricopeptide repeat protein [Planctomycetota bacterium]